MKRENIMAMADSYMNRYTEDYPFTKDTVFTAYIEGASRANYEHAKVWHKPSDEPENLAQIVCVCNMFGSKQVCSIRVDKSNLIEWKRIVEIRHIEQWAYFNELIPEL